MTKYKALKWGLLLFAITTVILKGNAQSFDGSKFYRLTTEWQGEGKSLDVLNDGKNNQLQLAQTGDFSGQNWKITDLSGPATFTPGIIKPPFHGTIFISPDILTAADPTTFSTLGDAGQADRTMFNQVASQAFF